MPRETLQGAVELEDLLDRLYFPETDLRQAVLEQAKLFLAAADYRVKKMRARQDAESEKERTAARYSLAARKKYAAQPGKKAVTEAHIRDVLSTVKELGEAEQKLATAQSLEEWSKLILEAYRQRRDVLKILAEFAFVEDDMRFGRKEMDGLKAKRDKLRASPIGDRYKDNVEEL